MKETENVPFKSMPQIITGSFLTKEQVEKLKEPFKDVVSVIRCKDCKFKECEGLDGFIVCDITGESHQPEWFCADGERAEAEVKDGD